MNKKLVIIALVVAALVAFGAAYVFMQDNEENDSTDTQPTTSQLQESSTTEELPANNDTAGTSLAGSEESERNDTTLNPDQPVSSAPQNQNITIDMSNYEYSVSSIKAKPGETITVELTNSGGTHNFVIDELNVESDTIGTGGNALVTFTVPTDAAGETYAFYCSIGNHRQLGMEGQLIISE